MGKTHACTDPHHHVHDAAGFVAAVERACNERGLRLTAIRARVLSLVAQAGRPIKAYDLLEQIRLDNSREGEGAGAAAPPTVYRALDFRSPTASSTSWNRSTPSSPATIRTAPSIRCRS